MLTIKLNHTELKVKDDQSILSVAKANGVEIPTLCHINRGVAKDKPRAVCRLCVVEVKGQNGLVTACSAKVKEGMEINTHTEQVIEAREVLMEFIIAENQTHSINEIDDNTTAKQDELQREAAKPNSTNTSSSLANQQTRVQELSQQIGVHYARFSLSKKAPVKPPIKSDFFNIDPLACVHCDRCIVACDSKNVIARSGFGHDVDTTFGGSEQGIEESDCNYCGDCVSACPAGGISFK